MGVVETAHLLGRGVVLVAMLEIWIPLIGIIACISGLVDPEDSWLNTIYEQYYSSTNFKYVLSCWLVTFGFQLLFGFLILYGVYTGRSGFLYIWYVPNVIMISIIFITTLVLAFTKQGFLITSFLELTCIRAFQIWIVMEFHAEIKYNNHW